MTDEMLRQQRVYFTMFHNREKILGRWDCGEGTLKLTLDEIGMKVECEVPETEDGDMALTLVKRGDLTEMSFAYSTDEEDTENCVSMEKTDETVGGRPVELRHVKRILNVYDVTIAANPAYDQSEVRAREQERQQR
jgi:HK97 family phage prohead protease